MAKKITWVSRFALALPPAQPFNSFKPVALLLLTMMLFIPSPSEANSYTYTSNITTYAGKGKKAKGNQVEQLSIDFNTVGPLTTGTLPFQFSMSYGAFTYRSSDRTTVLAEAAIYAIDPATQLPLKWRFRIESKSEYDETALESTSDGDSISQRRILHPTPIVLLTALPLQVTKGVWRMGPNVDSGNAKRAKGDLDGAIEDYTKAIQLKPRNADAYYERGLAKRAKGDLDGAIADFTNAVELKPDFAEAYGSRGDAKKAKGDLDGANADHTKYIQLKPQLEPQ